MRTKKRKRLYIILKIPNYVTIEFGRKISNDGKQAFFYRVVRTEGVFCRIHRRDGGYSGITR